MNQDQKFHKEVCERDGYVCQKCNKNFNYPCYFNEKGVNQYVCAHHIKSKKSRPDLRYDLKNGKCLCDKCHKAVHSGS